MALFRSGKRSAQLSDSPPGVVAALEEVWASVHAEPYDANWHLDAALRTHASVGKLVNASDEERAETLVALLQVAAQPSPQPVGGPVAYPVMASALAQTVARKALRLTASQVATILRASIEVERHNTTGWAGSYAPLVLDPALKIIEREAAGWTPQEWAELTPVLEAAVAASGATPDSQSAGLKRVLRSSDSGRLPLHLVDRDEDLGRQLAAALESSPEQPEALGRVMEVIDGLPVSGKASARWVKSAEAAVRDLADPGALVAALIDAMLAAGSCVDDYSGTPAAGSGATYEYFSGETNEAFALGVLRLAGVVADVSLLEPLRRTATYMLVIIGGEYGAPRSVKLANAAVVAIADAALPESITELLALERTVRHGSLLNQIRKSIDALAAAQGVTRDELLEQAVESHGLGPDGTREVPLSRGTARIQVSSQGAALAYVEPSGAVKKTVPSAVKEANEATLAELREELKGIRKTLAGERHRLDGLLAVQPSWPIEDWRRWYLDHPITGRLARDLIWSFTDEAGAEVVGRPQDGATVLNDAGNRAAIPSGAQVRLWHPVTAAPTEVGAWRHHCLEHRVVQPVKQAYREIYVLTPAEHETGVYSNRFAAHVFRQVQARALMKGRDWKAPPLAWWDDGRDVGTATRAYDRAGIRVEFVYDPIVEIEPDGGDLYPLCSSDQVRFLPAGEDEPLPLTDVPPVVLSEAMRDVDLFIGVTSIGADPEWEDRGDGPVAARLNEYWTEFSFGALSASAEIRRELIAGLLPSLAIADRLTLEERFLVVRGDLRTYRIHLGSGNIQMEPNAEYLCIVTARSAKTGKLFLPLDDDPVLTLILSKAFLLADDANIKDPTILAQIRRR